LASTARLAAGASSSVNFAGSLNVSIGYGTWRSPLQRPVFLGD
jgi:hypothetical protein